MSFPILEISGRRASPSAYNDDSVKKRHNDVPMRNEVYQNKPPLGIETPLLHCVNGTSEAMAYDYMVCL